MTCSLAMRGFRKSLFVAGLTVAPALRQVKQLTSGGRRRSPPTPPNGHPRGPKTFDWRRQNRRSNLFPASPLVDFLRPATGGAGAGGGGLGAAVAVGAVVGEGQRRLDLELALEARAALLPALLDRKSTRLNSSHIEPSRM